MTWRWLSYSLSCAVALLMCASARAEPVSVRSGSSTGQGWAFTQNGACWLATAGHVIHKGAGILITGANGVQGQGGQIIQHESLDLAFAQINGSLGHNCPRSTLGDRDTSALLQRLLREGRTIVFERRLGSSEGGGLGVGIVPVEVVGLSEDEATFTIRILKVEEDAIVQSDSGSPVRMRGDGVLEAGLPLGLVLADAGGVEVGYVTVLRMDAVRAAAGQLGQQPRKPDMQSAKASQKFDILAFSGETPATECAPGNLKIDQVPCGWRVRKSGTFPTLEVGFSEPRALSVVRVVFAPGFSARGVSVATRASTKSGFGPERYCSVPEGAVSGVCTLGQRTAGRVRLVFDAEETEITSVSFEE